jgi:hypothetical protein
MFFRSDVLSLQIRRINIDFNLKQLSQLTTVKRRRMVLRKYQKSDREKLLVACDKSLDCGRMQSRFDSLDSNDPKRQRRQLTILPCKEPTMSFDKVKNQCVTPPFDVVPVESRVSKRLNERKGRDKGECGSKCLQHSFCGSKGRRRRRWSRRQWRTNERDVWRKRSEAETAFSLGFGRFERQKV